jgi:CspA family cold shock protein
MLGVVKWFHPSKGFGFIVANDKDYFLHFKQLQCDGFKTIEQNTRVEFEPMEGPKGMVATNVRWVNRQYGA